MALVPPSSCPPFFPASPPSIDFSSFPPFQAQLLFCPFPVRARNFPGDRKRKERRVSLPLSAQKKKEEKRTGNVRSEEEGEEEKLSGHERTLFPPLQTTFTQTFRCVAHGRSSPLLSRGPEGKAAAAAGSTPKIFCM